MSDFCFFSAHRLSSLLTNTIPYLLLERLLLLDFTAVPNQIKGPTRNSHDTVEALVLPISEMSPIQNALSIYIHNTQGAKLDDILAFIELV